MPKLPSHFTDTPAPPSVPRITDTTKHSISMTWTRPMYDGGSDVTGYVVEILEEGTEQWYRATQKILSSNTYTVTGLASNKKYSFRVAGVNAMGTGEFSEGSIEASPSERIGKFFLRSTWLIMINSGVHRPLLGQEPPYLKLPSGGHCNTTVRVLYY